MCIRDRFRPCFTSPDLSSHSEGFKLPITETESPLPSLAIRSATASKAIAETIIGCGSLLTLTESKKLQKCFPDGPVFSSGSLTSLPLTSASIMMAFLFIFGGYYQSCLLYTSDAADD